MSQLTYVVTGANRGLGLEFCRQLAPTGARIIATARTPEQAPALQELAAEVAELSLEPLDVADPASVAALARRLEGSAVDVLINNAGRGSAGPGIAELDVDELARLYAVNSLGPLRVTQALLPKLRRGRRRCVVSISSNLGSITNNTQGGYYGYRASKAALNMLNRSLAHELGREGFVCVVLHPGWVRTDMGGKQAPLETEESVSGMLQVIKRLSPPDNGGFFDHTGATLPW